MTDADDDVPQLSSGALEALAEFYQERDTREKRFEDLKATAENDFDEHRVWSMDDFTEDWNASQFWYSDETAIALAEQLLDDATDDTWIAVVSAPSVFIQIKNLLASGKYHARPNVRLLEYDERFAVFKEFVPYDFMQFTKLPPDLKGRFDRIICDPPFLSQDCQTKAALTVRWLAKSWTAPASDPTNSLRLIVCTGERMGELIRKLYAKVGIYNTTFEPKHAKGLSNEFFCYANFESPIWDWAQTT